MNRWSLILVVAGALLVSISHVASAGPPPGPPEIVFRPQTGPSGRPLIGKDMPSVGTINSFEDYANQSNLLTSSVTLLLGSDGFLFSQVALELLAVPDTSPGLLMYIQIDSNKKQYCWYIDPTDADHEFTSTHLDGRRWLITDKYKNLTIVTDRLCPGSY
jgi:hypothetical protein